MTRKFDNGKVRAIMVIDDDPGVLVVVDIILQKEGYKVVSARSVEQAIETATSLAGRIVLFIVDHSLSAMPGRNVVEEIEKLQPGVKVLRFSGDSEDDLRVTGQMKAESSFLQKPFTTQALRKKVLDIVGPPSGSI
jgi:two-component system, cell cycle sensor histidine kinase and response regulator CckA